jgi:hypothetical protein
MFTPADQELGRSLIEGMQKEASRLARERDAAVARVKRLEQTLAVEGVLYGRVYGRDTEVPGDPAGAVVFRKEKDGREYTVNIFTQIGSGTPLIYCVETGKGFSLSLMDIWELALKAGIAD